MLRAQRLVEVEAGRHGAELVEPEQRREGNHCEQGGRRPGTRGPASHGGGDLSAGRSLIHSGRRRRLPRLACARRDGDSSACLPSWKGLRCGAWPRPRTHHASPARPIPRPPRDPSRHGSDALPSRRPPVPPKCGIDRFVPGRYSGVQAGASGQSHYQADKQSQTSPRRGMTIAVGACLDAGDLQGFAPAHDAAAHDPVVVQPRRRGVGQERTGREE